MKYVYLLIVFLILSGCGSTETTNVSDTTCKTLGTIMMGSGNNGYIGCDVEVDGNFTMDKSYCIGTKTKHREYLKPDEYRRKNRYYATLRNLDHDEEVRVYIMSPSGKVECLPRLNSASEPNTVPVDSSDIKNIEEQVGSFFSDITNATIVMGRYTSITEKLALSQIIKQYPKLKNYNQVSDAEYIPKGSESLILIGGPNQNKISAQILTDKSIHTKEYHLPVGSLYLISGKTKHIMFSDVAGFKNVARVNQVRSPLAKFIPEAFVPVAATAIGFSLLWFWKALGSLFSKLVRRLVSGKIMKRIKKKQLKTEYKGLKIYGVRIKYREWISIFITATIFALSISYSYFTNRSFIIFVIINIIVNMSIYSITHMIRLVMDKHYNLHREYHVWWWGAIVTIATGWLGNTFSLAGYVVSDGRQPKNTGKVGFTVNIITLFSAVLFIIWNLIAPGQIIQMCMIFAMSIALLDMIPLNPFSGKEVFKWSKKAWISLFIPEIILYFAVSLIV